MFHIPEKWRITLFSARLFGLNPERASSERFGNNGVFRLPATKTTRELYVQASDGGGWEHVSIHAASSKSRLGAIPNWTEMCYVKDIFWEPDDCVVQYHPPKSEYVHSHPNVLHLWRCADGRVMPAPPYWMVGAKDGQAREEAIAEGDAQLAAYGGE